MQPRHIYLANFCEWKQPHGASEHAAAEEGMQCQKSSTPVLLAGPRINQQWGNRGIELDEWVNRAFFTMDWWFAAAPSVVATWIDIDRHWEQYVRSLNVRGIAQTWSHWAWPAHIHLFLNASAKVRFLHFANTIGRLAFVDLFSSACNGQQKAQRAGRGFNGSSWAACTMGQAGAAGKLFLSIGRCDALRVGPDRKRHSTQELVDSSWSERPRDDKDLESHLRAWAAKQCPFTSQLVKCTSEREDDPTPTTIAFECTDAELAALDRIRRFAEEAMLVNDSAAVESLLARMPDAGHVNASRAKPGYCKAVDRGSGDCEAGHEGSWGVTAVSEDEMMRVCTSKCASCARCRYVSYSRKHYDCSWVHECDFHQLQTDVQGFYTQKMYGK